MREPARCQRGSCLEPFPDRTPLFGSSRRFVKSSAPSEVLEAVEYWIGLNASLISILSSNTETRVLPVLVPRVWVCELR